VTRIIEVDTETTGIQWYAHSPFLVQFLAPAPDLDPDEFDDPDEYQRLYEEEYPKPVLLRHPEDREEIQRWLDDPDAHFRAWNTKFDCHFLDKAGYALPPQDRWEDGMLMAHILDERRPVALQKVGDAMFGGTAEAETEKEVKDWLSTETRRRKKESKDTGCKFERPNYSDVPSEIMFPYAAHDVTLQRRICDVLEPKLAENADLVKVYELERKVLGALYDVEKLGINIDAEGAAKFEREVHDELTKLRQKAIDLSGDPEFNPNSGMQIAEALERRGVDLSHVERSGKTGKLKMAAEVLAGLDDELPRAIELFRQQEKLYTTYLWPLLHDEPDTTMGFKSRYLHTDGRLHTDLRQVGARTGRMSSSPNVQNWPRDDLRMRHLVVARPGYKLVAVDLDSIELVIFAAFLGEGPILEMMRDEDADLHTHTAKMIGLGERDRGGGVVESPRQRGKKFNYERIYGGGVKAIMKWHGVDMQTARRYLNAYLDAYPEVQEFKEMIELRLEERGFVKTPWGRRHRADNPRFAERESYKFVNYLVQGTAADLFKEAVVRVHEAGIPMIALTHDEILAEVPESEAEAAGKVIVEAMCDHPIINKVIQVKAEAIIVDRWSGAKDPDFDPGW
jgi:DNA polymerase I